MSAKTLFITKHAMERYRERTSIETPKGELDLIDQIKTRIKKSTEERSYINNTNLMLTYYDKYGYDRNFKFMVEDDIVFVIVTEKTRDVLVTCILSKDHPAGRATNRPKFKKTPKPHDPSDVYLRRNKKYQMW